MATVLLSRPLTDFPIRIWSHKFQWLIKIYINKALYKLFMKSIWTFYLILGFFYKESWNLCFFLFKGLKEVNWFVLRVYFNKIPIESKDTLKFTCTYICFPPFPSFMSWQDFCSNIYMIFSKLNRKVSFLEAVFIIFFKGAKVRRIISV